MVEELIEAQGLYVYEPRQGARVREGVSVHCTSEGLSRSRARERDRHSEVQLCTDSQTDTQTLAHA